MDGKIHVLDRRLFLLERRIRMVRSQSDLLVGDARRKLEICAGYRPMKLDPDWIRHDCRKHVNIDLICDVWEVPTFVLPCMPLQEIFSKNFLEHLTMLEGKLFLRMCWNMLEPGGRMGIEIPNMDWIVQQYVSGEYESPEYFLEWFFGGTGDEWWNLHKTMYNADLLRGRLVEGGFEITRIKTWDTGYSLFGEAIK